MMTPFFPSVHPVSSLPLALTKFCEIGANQHAQSCPHMVAGTLRHRRPRRVSRYIENKGGDKVLNSATCGGLSFLILGARN